MSLVSSAAAGLGAAACFGTASTLQHHAARESPQITGTAKKQTRVLVRVISQPAWIAGAIADFAGIALQAVALSLGPLSFVQPMLVTGLLFALVASAIFARRAVSVSEVVWAATLTASLAIFLELSQPDTGSGHTSLVAEAIVGLVVVVSVLAGVMSIRHASPIRQGVTLGALTGALYGVGAALMKVVVHEAQHGVVHAIVSLPLLALLAVGAVGFYLNQRAFQAGQLRVSLPAITAVDPVVSIVIGIALLNERLHGGAGAHLFQGAALVCLLLATTKLSVLKERKAQLS